MFSAALEQSEQLLRSAEQLGYASRPLNLFYGLSQAGRAVAAAWSKPEFSTPGGEDRSWRLSGHGISAVAGSLDGPLEQLRVGDKPAKPLPNQSTTPLPAFPAVARVLGSSSLQRPAHLVDIWAALPDAVAHPAPGAAARWRALHLDWDATETAAIAAWLGPLPDSIATDWSRGLNADLSGVLSSVRAQYPQAWRDEDEIEVDGRSWEPGSAAVWLRWTSPSVFGASAEDRGMLRDFHKREFEGRLPDYRGRKWLIPLIEGQALSPLPTWWALLFTMSMLARYHPESWSRAIDVDSSEWAVPVEHLLDEALEALPEVVFQALEAEPLHRLPALDEGIFGSADEGSER